MTETSTTRALVDGVCGLGLEDVPDAARDVARHCVLDWLGCALAGSLQPLSQILLREIVPSEHGEATLIGRPERATLLTAALVNGAMSHALDFDDTHWMMNGHPSAPVLPAALALAERDDLHGTAFLPAVIAGIEFECRLGALIGGPHYAAGFHATGSSARSGLRPPRRTSWGSTANSAVTRSVLPGRKRPVSSRALARWPSRCTLVAPRRTAWPPRCLRAAASQATRRSSRPRRALPQLMPAGRSTPIVSYGRVTGSSSPKRSSSTTPLAT